MNKEKENYPDWLVPIDIAKELKEIGFNEACPFIVYPDEDEVVITGVTNVDIDEVDENEGYDVCADLVVNQCYAFNKHNMQTIPTWTDVFAWFRKRGLYGFITFDNTYPNSVSETFSFEIRKINRKLIYSSEENSTDEFNCYEEAREALVFKLIEIYKTQIITS